MFSVHHIDRGLATQKHPHNERPHFLNGVGATPTRVVPGQGIPEQGNDCWQSGCHVIYPNDSVKGLTGILTGRVE